MLVAVNDISLVFFFFWGGKNVPLGSYPWVLFLKVINLESYDRSTPTSRRAWWNSIVSEFNFLWKKFQPNIWTEIENKIIQPYYLRANCSRNRPLIPPKVQTMSSKTRTHGVKIYQKAAPLAFGSGVGTIGCSCTSFFFFLLTCVIFPRSFFVFHPVFIRNNKSGKKIASNRADWMNGLTEWSENGVWGKILDCGSSGVKRWAGVLPLFERCDGFMFVEC